MGDLPRNWPKSGPKLRKYQVYHVKYKILINYNSVFMLPNVMPVENKDYLTAFDIFLFVVAIFWLVFVIFRTKSKLKVKIPEIGPLKKATR